MLKNTKAQGMSIKIIIIAIIGLIILLVVVLMLTGKLSDFGGGLKSVGDPSKTCESQVTDGQPQEAKCGNKEVSILFRNPEGKKNKCCKPE